MLMMKKLFRKIWRRKWFLLVILAITGGGFLYYRQGQQKKNEFEESEIKRGQVRQELVLTGEIDALERASLSFETSGKLIYVGVKEGDRVRRGTLLGKLDTTSLNAAYEQALNNLRRYQATIDNVYDSLQNHEDDETFAQKDTRTTAEVARDNAYEAVIIAEHNLKGASLYAPFDGVVTSVTNPFSGPFVLSTQPQFEVVNPETIYFRVTADQTEVTSLKEGMKVLITLDSFPEKEIEGVVSRIDFAPDPNEVSVVYEVEVDLPQLEEIDYRLGMTGDAIFVLESKEEAFWVPAGFVKSDKQGQYLLTQKGDRKVYVELGFEGSERVEVISDEISEGMKIYD